jgi:hypothetical protein
MQAVKKKPRRARTEVIKTVGLALAVVAVGVWTQISKPHASETVPDPEVIEAFIPTVAVEPADPSDNDAAPIVPDLSPVSPEATPDGDNA